MTKAPKKTLRGQGRVAFLARVEDFRKMVEAGHPLLGIYESNAGDLGISYSQFARYVAQYIRKESPSHEPRQQPHQPVAQPAPATSIAHPAPAPGGSAGAGQQPAAKPTAGTKRGGAFTFDPTGGNDDKLI